MISLQKTISLCLVITVVSQQAVGGEPPPRDGLAWQLSAGDIKADAGKLSSVVDDASPGDRIVFADGEYRPITVGGLHGTAEEPIVIEAANALKASFSSGHRNRSTGVTLVDCHHVVVRGLVVRDTQKGIHVHACTHCVVEDCHVYDLGQEGLHVGRGETNTASAGFAGPASHHITLRNNRVERTGLVTAIYGEGIYIGTGAVLGDDSHDIVVEGNTLRDISAEAIELKPGTYNLVVRNNDIARTHHEYNGAITACVEGTPSRSGNYLIENNRIRDVRKVRYSVVGIAIGHGNAVIRCNVISNVDGGVGIQTLRRFQNPDAIRIEIVDNIIRTDGPGDPITLHQGNTGREDLPLRADVILTGNQTDR